MSEPTSPSPDRFARLRALWLNPRRTRFWAVALLLAYTMLGFFALPWFGQNLLVNVLQNEHGRALRITEMRVNPYTFRIELTGVALDDNDGHHLAGFEQLVVDLEWSSLFNRAWTFRELRLVDPWLDDTRSADGNTRLSRLIGEFAPDAAQVPPQQPRSLPALLIHQLQLVNGHGLWTDQTTEPAVELKLGPVTVEMQEIDTRPDRSGQQVVQIHFENNGALSWRGALSLNPLLAEGSLEFSQIEPDKLLPYLRPWVALNDLHLRYDGSLDYRIALSDGAGLELGLSNIGFEITELALSAFEPKQPFLSTDAIRLSGGEFHYPEMRATIGALEIDGPKIETWLEPNHQPALLALLSKPDAEPAIGPAPAGKPGDANPFTLELSEFRINDLQVNLEDRSLTPAALIALNDVDASLKAINLTPGSRFPARLSGALGSGGRFLFEGGLTARPEVTIDGEIRVDELGIALAQPYLNPIARIGINDGVLSLAGTLSSTPREPLNYDGTLRIDRLQLADQIKHEPLLGWASLTLEQVGLSLAAGQLKTGRATFDQPTGSLIIGKNGGTNLSDLLVPSETAVAAGKPAATESGAGPFNLDIGSIEFKRGSLDFADLSLPLPFSTKIQALNGQISRVSSNSTEAAVVKLEGQVDDYGLARINGSLRPFDPLQLSDIQVDFRNLEVPSYSPYSIRFAGRAIASGKLDLDLRYRIKNGLMQGDNSIVLRDFKLGEKVDSPDAMSLPLGLAIPLLKDANGVINLDLPVEGDVNNPEFRTGGVIWRAITQLISQVATSPFRVLGALIGVKSDEFGQFQFLAGRSDLTPPQAEMALKLHQALLQRPGLGVEISGSYDPALDRPVLQREMALAAVRTELEADNGVAPGLTMTDEVAWPALETLFVDAYPETPLEPIRARHSTPPVDQPTARPVLDELAFYNDLASRVIAAQPVTDEHLKALGNARAEVVRNALLSRDTGALETESGTTIAAERINISAPVTTTAEEDGWVPITLKITTH
ncbi:MAG: DUF748 domain-containing protein [Gammaproteobacteria bacterium]|nr:DUF748 domain-containing protein [Gammaproteobacteria bacterium]